MINAADAGMLLALGVCDKSGGVQHWGLVTCLAALAGTLPSELGLVHTQLLHRHAVLLAGLHRVPALQLRGVARPAPAVCSGAGLLYTGETPRGQSLRSRRTALKQPASPTICGSLLLSLRQTAVLLYLCIACCRHCCEM